MTVHTTLLNSMPEMVAIRRDLHEHPELGLEEFRTSDVIARHLESYGYKVTTGKLAGYGDERAVRADCGCMTHYADMMPYEFIE